MQIPSFDPGLTQQFTVPWSRAIEKDGTFNVRRRGATWRDFHPYLHLVNMGWLPFLAVLFLGFVVVNTIFAAIYFELAPGQLQGAEAANAFDRFLKAFFFSSHTLTTVGYGNISPQGIAANAVASVESLLGVLGFAVATGLLFGRVSRPSARIGFSDNMVIAPYQDSSSLQFRVVNRRANSLVELEARVVLMTVEPGPQRPRRIYTRLRLERPRVLFLPLTWTIVHPIEANSPLWGKTPEDLERLQAEVMILIKAYDDTFSQTVLARSSYTHREIQWNVRFEPAFYVDRDGGMVLELPKLGATEPALAEPEPRAAG
jgi:inward rectifier potassium channel